MRKAQEKVLSKTPEGIFSSLNFYVQAFVVAITGFILYANTATHEYAFDDGLVIIENKWVQQGFSGISEIMTHGELDAFYEKYGSKEQFSGGRYRPLSIVTFAIENEFFGDNPNERHVVNILLYMLTLVVMLALLRTYIFPKNPDAAFIATLLFAMHPLHSEVVANIKNRSEILALLFALLTMFYAFRWTHTQKIKDGIVGAGCLILALLSKEYGVVMFVLIPLSFFIFTRLKPQNILLYSLPFWLVIVAYIALRLGITQASVSNKASTEVLNNQYLLATSGEKIATKIYVLWLYLKAMFIPYPLSCDYSYNQIPFIQLSNYRFAGALILYIAISIATLWLIVKRHVAGFFLAFYLGHLFLISNLTIEIGTTYSERLAYIPSLGIVLLIAWGLTYGIKKAMAGTPNAQPVVVISLLSIFFLMSFFIVFNRNKVWKNDATLFIHDVKTSPNSVIVLGNAGKNYLILAEDSANILIKDSLLEQSVKYSSRAVEIHPRFLNGHINLCIAYILLKNYDAAERSLHVAAEVFPSHPKVQECSVYLSNQFLNAGVIAGIEQKDYDKAIYYMQKAGEWNPGNAEIYYNMGGVYFTKGDYANAMIYWQKTLSINPNHIQAQQGMMAITTNPELTPQK